MSLRTYVIIIGTVRLALAVALAVVPITTAGLSCGTVLAQQIPLTDIGTIPLAQVACDSAWNTRALWAAIRAGGGLLVLIGGMFARSPERVAP